MHYSPTASFLVALLSVSVVASPLNRRDGDYSKIHRQANPGASPRNGTQAMLRAYQKYQWGAPITTNEHISTNAASDPVNEKLATGGVSGSGSGLVAATPEQHNSEYLCPVTIGGQSLNLDIDTGSSDL